MTAIAVCHCGCQHPSADPARREQHALNHRAFAEWIAEMPDWGFRKPSFRQIVEWTAQEMSAPTGCPRLEHVGTIPHPVH